MASPTRKASARAHAPSKRSRPARASSKARAPRPATKAARPAPKTARPAGKAARPKAKAADWVVVPDQAPAQAAPPLSRAERLQRHLDRRNQVRVPPLGSRAPLEVAMPVAATGSPPAPAAPPPAAAPPLDRPARFASLRRLFAISLMLLLLAVVAATTTVTSQGNSGTIKVHGGSSASPPTRNEPHVTGDVFVEGFNMADDSGRIFIFSWPPTGDGSLVLQGNWSADGADPANHFLAGPFDLPCGHYRVGVSNGPATPDDFPGGMKKKTFWVDGCSTSPPSCGAEGAPPCETCGTETTPPCETCGTPDTPPCATCGTDTTPPCPTCGTEDTPPCMACPSDLAAVPNADGSVTLTWTEAPGSDGTNLYRADAGGDFEYLATVPAGTHTYTDTTTVAGGSYEYTATGLYGDSESQGCSVVAVTAIPELPSLAAVGLASGGGLLALVLARRRGA